MLGDRRVGRLDLPALEVRSVRVTGDRIEVVPDPQRVEPEAIREYRALAHARPGRVLRPEVDPKFHDLRSPVSTLSPCSAPRAAFSRLSSLSARSWFSGRSSSCWAAIRAANPGRPPFSGRSLVTSICRTSGTSPLRSSNLRSGTVLHSASCWSTPGSSPSEKHSVASSSVRCSGSSWRSSSCIHRFSSARSCRTWSRRRPCRSSRSHPSW